MILHHLVTIRVSYTYWIEISFY